MTDRNNLDPGPERGADGRADPACSTLPTGNQAMEDKMTNVDDPVADLLTHIRNAQLAGHATVETPASNLREAILEILVDRGYLGGVERIDQGPQGILRAGVRYDQDGEGMIQSMKRVSRPARRVYVGVDEIPDVLNGLGIAILSTSRGVLAGDDAQAANVGGELLAKVY